MIPRTLRALRAVALLSVGLACPAHAQFFGGGSANWHVIGTGPLANRPATCKKGDVWACIGTGCTTGTEYHYCTSANTWSAPVGFKLPDPSQSVGKVLSTDGTVASWSGITLNPSMNFPTFQLCQGAPCAVSTDVAPRQVAPITGTLDKCMAYVKTGPTGAPLQIDVLKNGTSIFAGTYGIQIAAGSTTASTNNFASSTVTEGDIFSASILGVGSTTAGQYVTIACRLKYSASGITDTTPGMSLSMEPFSTASWYNQSTVNAANDAHGIRFYSETAANSNRFLLGSIPGGSIASGTPWNITASFRLNNTAVTGATHPGSFWLFPGEADRCTPNCTVTDWDQAYIAIAARDSSNAYAGYPQCALSWDGAKAYGWFAVTGTWDQTGINGPGGSPQPVQTEISNVTYSTSTVYWLKLEQDSSSNMTCSYSTDGILYSPLGTMNNWPMTWNQYGVSLANNTSNYDVTLTTFGLTK